MTVLGGLLLRSLPGCFKGVGVGRDTGETEVHGVCTPSNEAMEGSMTVLGVLLLLSLSGCLRGVVRSVVGSLCWYV